MTIWKLALHPRVAARILNSTPRLNRNPIVQKEWAAKCK